jgi:hypothetical protein
MLTNERAQRTIVLRQTPVKQKRDSGNEEAVVNRMNQLFHAVGYDGIFVDKSIADVPINAATPAVINAVCHAIGIRFRKLPERPEDVLQAFTERAASRAAE